MARRPPCKSCPWRVGSDADAIPNFSPELAEGLVSTTGRDFGAPVFSCHQSREGEEFHCAGWLAIYGADNIGVRLAMRAGRVDPEAVGEAPESWPELYEDFEAMIANLRETYTGTPTPEAAEAALRMAERAMGVEDED